MTLGLLRWPLLGALLAVTSCRRPAEAPAPLRLVSVWPSTGSRVSLNEPVVVTFDQNVDLASLTKRSARLEANGTPRPGSWVVEGPVLTFHPDPLLSADLSRGSWTPGARHELILGGFPRPDALRSVEGGQLDRSLRLAFEARGESEEPLLLDLSMEPLRCEPIRVESTVPGSLPILGRGQAVRLLCDEPLDPRSLEPDAFWFEQDVTMGPPSELGPRVGARPVLVENRRFEGRGEGPCARLDLWPDEDLEDGLYLVRARSGSALRDMGGNPAIREPGDPVLARVRVLGSHMQGRGRARLEFALAQEISSEPVPWADGAARAGTSGTLGVHLPAAVGSGSEGAVVLVGPQTQPHFESTSLRVPAGEHARWSSLEGPMVLRAQGSLTIAGKLSRGESVGERVRVKPLGAGRQSLSEWLAEVQAGALPWTILIAGGDLLIEGDLEVDTPLILVAGGRIRVRGRVTCPLEDVFVLGEGGGPGLAGIPSALPGVQVDLATENRLARPLLFAAASSALPREASQRYDWGRLSLGAHEGGGDVQVSFCAVGAPLERGSLVPHPRMVEGQGAVRAIFELRVFPGESWDPPRVDFLELEWSPKGP